LRAKQEKKDKQAREKKSTQMVIVISVMSILHQLILLFCFIQPLYMEDKAIMHYMFFARDYTSVVRQTLSCVIFYAFNQHFKKAVDLLVCKLLGEQMTVDEFSME
jgi:hypothetical protein